MIWPKAELRLKQADSLAEVGFGGTFSLAKTLKVNAILNLPRIALGKFVKLYETNSRNADERMPPSH